jgi:hypothetical protein
MNARTKIEIISYLLRWAPKQLVGQRYSDKIIKVAARSAEMLGKEFV